MEVVLALIVFAVLVLTWLVLPSSVTAVTVKETPALVVADGLQMAAAEA
jgi:hypothetical protein